MLLAFFTINSKELDASQVIALKSGLLELGVFSWGLNENRAIFSLFRNNNPKTYIHMVCFLQSVTNFCVFGIKLLKRDVGIKLFVRFINPAN